MQEVFEKIINDKVLEKAWQPLGTFNEHSPLVIKVSDVEKIVKQAAAECSECYKECKECEAYDKEKHFCPKFCHVIQETVKEIKENNNNGWIPCSERLPEEPEEAPTEEATIEELILDGKIKEYNVTIEGANISTTLYYAGNGYWYDEVIEDYFPVIAWQPLPELYEQKGERKA